MTAYAMSDDKHICLSVGMDAYIANPIDGEQVLRLLSQFLSAGDPRNESKGEGRS